MSTDKTRDIPPAAAQEAAADTVTLTVTAAQGLCLRCGPGQRYGVLKVLPKGTKLKAARGELGRDWPGVTAADGTAGYVSTLYVKEGR